MTGIDWHTLPPLTTLRAFEATARLQGYSAAARALNVTPAAVAQQVRKLEAEVGEALVRRDGRGLALTEAGRHLALPLREAFSMIAAGLGDLKSRRARLGVRVSTTDGFANAVILPGLGDFWKRHPALQVSLSPDAGNAPVDLDNFDIAVRGGPPGQRWDGYRETVLHETPFVICGAPGLVGPGPADPASLPWIRDRGIGWAVFQRMIRETGGDPDTIDIVDTGSAHLELEAALLGYGLCVSPELTVRRHLADGSLITVHRSTRMTAVYYAICHTGPLAEPVRQFLDWMLALRTPPG